MVGSFEKNQTQNNHFVSFGSTIGKLTGIGQYGPFVYQKKPKEDTEKLNF